jgi:sarcosine oxidase, subunit alpha
VTSGPYRLPSGGLIDRQRPIAFTWQGHPLQGLQGDTLAAALLANGVRVLARSFKRHRPRGLMAAGIEEANALVEVGPAGQHQPNRRATEVALAAGLCARAQHAWPHLHWDLGGLVDWASRFLPAGFYYKTFRWPSWHFWEPLIRRAAGLGRAPTVLPDEGPAPTCHERHEQADVLVIGAGPAGLAAAVQAAHLGQRVWLVERDFEFGGSLLWRPDLVDGLAPMQWRDAQLQTLREAGVTLLRRTVVSALFGPQRALLWRETARQASELIHLHCQRTVLATGANERPLLFAGNDRPGVMLATAACEYARRFGVAVGRRVLVLTNGDEGWRAAKLLEDSGVGVVALLDTRPAFLAPALDLRAPAYFGARVIGTSGRLGLKGVSWHDASGTTVQTQCDALAVHGGWNPVAALASHAGLALRWNDSTGMLGPVGNAPAGNTAAALGTGLPVTDTLTLVGAASGLFAGRLDSQAAATHARHPGVFEQAALPQALPPPAAASPSDAHLQWVDLQNDVTVADIELAYREGMGNVEHLKRYTTLGMAPDQGRTSQAAGLLALAQLRQQAPSELGSARPRPPVFPLPLGALAAHRRGPLYRPIKQLPLQGVHEALGAAFEDYGGWRRPACYPRPGETEAQAIQREAGQGRTGVVLMDASPLGKIEIRGPDATTFLERIYANAVTSLVPGRTRYGLMLNERGIIIDDGVLSCLATGPQAHYIVGTTSGAATRIHQHLEEWHQTEWPELDLVIHDATAQWGVVTVSGPQAPALVARLDLGIDLSAAACPHLAFRAGRARLGDPVAECPVRLQRVSFTGERSFEIAVPSRHTARLWQALWQAGQDLGVSPLGIEALMVLRIEKGYLHVGSDTDATTTPDDVGMGVPARRKPMIAIGRRGLDAPDMQREDRLQLVGLKTTDGCVLDVGSHVLAAGASRPPARSDGHVGSSVFSPALGAGVALALLRGGRARMGQTVSVWSGGRAVAAVVGPTCFFDPEGQRLRDDG